MRRRWVVVGAAVLVVAVVGGVVVAATRDESDAAHDVVVTAEVGRQRLQEKVTLTGQLTRNEQRKVTAAASARVGAVVSKDGESVEPGQTIMELDGRAAVAVDGDLSFYRSLDVGDRGPDVRQLNQILADGGFDPGPVTDSYTERTRSALGRWQAAHDYPSAATAKSQTLTMALGQGTGYKNGPKSTASVVVAGSTSATGTTGATRPIAFRQASGPGMTIRGTQTITDGATATLTIEADSAVEVDTQVSLSVSGDLVAWQDYLPFDPFVVIPAGASTATVTVTTLPHTSITHDKRLVVSITPSSGGAYTIAPIATAIVTVLGQTGDAALPVITISSPTAVVTKGQAFTVTLTLSVVTSERLVAQLAFGGTAAPGADFVVPTNEIVIPAGQTSVAVSIATVSDRVVEPDSTLTVSIAARDGYVVGLASSVTTTIESTNVPELSVSTTATSVGPGGTATFTITADQPVAEDTSVNFQLGGTAVVGQDYKPVPTTVVLRAGQSTFDVAVTTIRHDVVFKPGDMVVGSWPSRVGQVLVEQDQVVAAGTPLFSLTEASFTVQLTASPSDRTKLEVGQSVTVKLSGGTTQAPGTISQLDDSVTVDAQSGAQTYCGTVDVEDLGAADGATVTIDVVLEERADALVVPIASVKQNGSGEDVVRVIDLAAGGEITEVLVTTGITEGSYIEILSGLEGGEVVIVETSPTANGTSVDLDSSPSSSEPRSTGEPPTSGSTGTSSTTTTR
jgi:hypothetical protein